MSLKTNTACMTVSLNTSTYVGGHITSRTLIHHAVHSLAFWSTITVYKSHFEESIHFLLKEPSRLPIHVLIFVPVTLSAQGFRLLRLYIATHRSGLHGRLALCRSRLSMHGNPSRPGAHCSPTAPTWNTVVFRCGCCWMRIVILQVK